MSGTVEGTGGNDSTNLHHLSTDTQPEDIETAVASSQPNQSQSTTSDDTMTTTISQTSPTAGHLSLSTYHTHIPSHVPSSNAHPSSNGVSSPISLTPSEEDKQDYDEQDYEEGKPTIPLGKPITDTGYMMFVVLY